MHVGTVLVLLVGHVCIGIDEYYKHYQLKVFTGQTAE